MEMEGRGFSGLYKNTSEELFLKTVMESPIGMPVPTMEMLGFKAASQSFRADSEELFKRWLTNGEASCYISHLDHVTLFCSVLACVRTKQKISMMPVCWTYTFSLEVSERIPQPFCVFGNRLFLENNRFSFLLQKLSQQAFDYKLF